MIEEGETPKRALIRELKEELGIEVEEADLEEFGTFSKPAGGQENYGVKMIMFVVKAWKGV